MNPLQQLEQLANTYEAQGKTGDLVSMKAAGVLLSLLAALHGDEQAIDSLYAASLEVSRQSHKRITAKMILG